jgi:hypothetical protein
MSTNEQLHFLSISNLKNLINIFEKFLTDRYALSIHDRKLNLKKIMFETMYKIQNDDVTKNLGLNDLNKITLSIVKNVIKAKLSLDKSFNSSLTRAREVKDDNEVHLHKMFRPVQTTDASKNKNILNEHQTLMDERYNESNESHDDVHFTLNEDKAMPDEMFLKQVNELMQNRETDINSTQTTNQANKELAQIFTENFNNHPKDLYRQPHDDNLDVTPASNTKRNDADSTSLGYHATFTKHVQSPTTVTKFLLIDSRDRDIVMHPEPNSYVVQFDNIIKNLCEVELMYALYYKNDAEQYVNLQITEFLPDTISNNQYNRDAFVQLPLIDYINEFSSQRASALKIFQQPLSKLSRITIKFMKYDGTLVDIGEHFMKFRVTYYNYNNLDTLVKTDEQKYDSDEEFDRPYDINNDNKDIEPFTDVSNTQTLESSNNEEIEPEFNPNAL